MKRWITKLAITMALTFTLSIPTASAVTSHAFVVKAVQDDNEFLFELSCLDRDNEVVSDLPITPDAWQVYLEGREHLDITDVSTNEKASVHYVIVAQSSSRLSQKHRKDVAKAVNVLISAMSGTDRMTIYQVDSEVNTLIESSSDKSQLTEVANSLGKSSQVSSQALYTAMETAVQYGDKVTEATDKTALIIFSDGHNNGKGVSSSTAALSTSIKHTGCRIFSVLLETSNSSNQVFLRDLCERTSGFLVQQKDIDATTAAQRIQRAVTQTILINGVNTNGEYSGITDSSWRITCIGNDSNRIRAGYTMPVAAWATQAPKSTPAQVSTPTPTALQQSSSNTPAPVVSISDKVESIENSSQITSSAPDNESIKSDPALASVGVSASSLLLIAGVGIISLAIAITVITILRKRKSLLRNEKVEQHVRVNPIVSNDAPPIHSNSESECHKRVIEQPIVNRASQYYSAPAASPHDLQNDEMKPATVQDQNNEGLGKMLYEPSDSSSIGITTAGPENTYMELGNENGLEKTIDESNDTPIDDDRTLVESYGMPLDLDKTIVEDVYKQTTLTLRINERGQERSVTVPLVMGREVWFGRQGDIPLLPYDLSISRKHFCITLTPISLTIRDESQIGVVVDGMFLNKAEKDLKRNSIIMVGGKHQNCREATKIEIVNVSERGDRKHRQKLPY